MFWWILTHIFVNIIQTSVHQHYCRQRKNLIQRNLFWRATKKRAIQIFKLFFCSLDLIYVELNFSLKLNTLAKDYCKKNFWIWYLLYHQFPSSVKWTIISERDYYFFCVIFNKFLILVRCQALFVISLLLLSNLFLLKTICHQSVQT